MGRKCMTRDEHQAAFWRKVDKQGPDECWMWLGARSSQGYGAASLGGRSVGAHRVAYLYHYGALPDSTFVVCHSCDTPECVNPSHLRADSRSANMADVVQRRAAGGAPGARAGVVRVHPVSPQGLAVGQLLAATRRASGLSCRAVARQLDIAPSTVSRWEAGMEIAFLDAVRLSLLYGCSVADFVPRLVEKAAK